MLDRRIITNFNWGLLLVALILSAMGLVNLYSATTSFDVQSHPDLFRAQIVYHIIGLGLMFFVLSIHYRHFYSLSYVIYGLTIFLLILVLVIGRKVMGHQSWVAIGPVRLQPTEMAKVGFVIAMARLMSTWQPKKLMGAVDLIPSFILFLIPTALVLMQGDLGSSIFFIMIYATLVIMHGVRWKLLVGIIISGIIISVIAYFFFLSNHQKNRILTFMNPEMDRKGAGYHLIQSKIAVGSGGFTGKGYLKGETHKLKFIPERHTDFIFAVLSEEWGFIGCTVVLLTYLLFIYLGLMSAQKANDRYGFYLCLGSCSIFFWHMVVNLCGILGLMPLTGVPLPFFSYGGSALLSDWIAVGLMLNVSMRRYMFS